MTRRTVARALMAAACAVCCRPAAGVAQTPAPDPSGPSPSGRIVSAAYELHRDRLRYEFKNPSSFSTPELVPHSFEQTYDIDNQWLAIAARYPVFGQYLESEFAFTPEITAGASDTDTFYNPGNDVITSGTSGDAVMRSFRVVQWSEGRLFGLPWRLGYIYRRDRSDFLPADIVVTHTNPVSRTGRLTTDRERTISEVHELPVDLAKEARISSRWRIVVGGTVSPLVLARLTTLLPDKYPGQRIVFQARVVDVAGRVQVVRQAGRWPLVFAASYGRTWSYQASARFRRDALQFSARLCVLP